MKYVQLLILGLLTVSAALLFEIYSNQQAAEVTNQEPDALTLQQEARAAEQVEFGLPLDAAVAADDAAPAPAKPKPTRRHRSEPAPAASPRPGNTAVAPVEVLSPVEMPTAPTESNLIADTVRSQPERPAPPPEPRRVTLPAGSHLVVRLSHSLSTERNLGGDTFYAHLDEPIVVDDMVIAEKGARAEGRVLEVQQAGRVKGLSQLSIELVRLNTADGQTVEVMTNRMHRQGEDSKSADAKKVGIGAAAGAIIGAIAGGGKGAAIGAGVGAGAGGSAVAATRGKPVEIPSETRLTFRLLDPVEVVEKL